jgi:hypothetical protein
MDATRYARLESLELACQTQQGDAWKLAWDVVDLAAEIHAEAGKTPPADALAATWYCLVFAKSCDRRLAAEGRTSADHSVDSRPGVPGSAGWAGDGRRDGAGLTATTSAPRHRRPGPPPHETGPHVRSTRRGAHDDQHDHQQAAQPDQRLQVAARRSHGPGPPDSRIAAADFA